MEKDKKAADRVKDQQVTYEIYAEMPDDGKRYEVIDGMLELMSPSPTAAHQSISLELIHELRQGCKTDYLIYVAPLDVILNDTNVVQPDVLMIHRSRQHIVTSRGVEGPPDLVVEVLSPGSRKRDRLKKMAVYEKHGVPEYWIIDPEARTLEQYRLNDRKQFDLLELFEGDDMVVSDKLPCVSFVVHRIFSDIPQ
ncbi:Uma2 family endonuclease [Cohnella herbarum]|uniref:Uma2 family endonuclease n=1 Tax=Cohnella herbarum TaxID=2728023 RepID=A0A7Z2VKU8_9BACL|nr:Uma2 family endonuclease [Cohnella herbarum]QJD84886.1 Uma2 family endonuclease [Cohnella herbarum]